MAVISVGPPDESHGEVKGFSLVYSGNFLVETELTEMSRLRVNMGIHPMGLQWHLKRGGDIDIFVLIWGQFSCFRRRV